MGSGYYKNFILLLYVFCTESCTCTHCRYMLIKKRIWSYKSDSECRHTYQEPLPVFISEIMKVFTCNSEWNERCAVEKVSQSYTSSRLARYGL